MTNWEEEQDFGIATVADSNRLSSSELVEPRSWDVVLPQTLM